MSNSDKYPLQQLATIKKKRLEDAEKLLKEKKAILAKEEEKQAALEKKRDEVKKHYQDKLTQLRAKLDEGTSTAKIQQMKQYLKIVVADLAVEEKKVEAQKKIVQQAAAQVELARTDLFKKQKDVEKLHLHQQEWKREMHMHEQQREDEEGSEIGGAVHHIKKTETKRRRS